jgi:hypothetical protein
MSNILDLNQIKAEREAEVYGKEVVNKALNMDVTRSVEAIQFVLALIPEAKTKRSVFNDYNSEEATSFDNEMMLIPSSDFLRVTEQVGFFVSIDNTSALPTLAFNFDAGAPVYTIEFPAHVDADLLKNFHDVIDAESQQNHSRVNAAGKELFSALLPAANTQPPLLETESLRNAIDISLNVHTPEHIAALLAHANSTPMRIVVDKDTQGIALHFSDNQEDVTLDFSNIDAPSFNFVSVIMVREVSDNDALFNTYRQDISERMQAASEYVKTLGGFDQESPDNTSPDNISAFPAPPRRI